MEHAPEFQSREDKLNKYIGKMAEEYLFDELSPEYIHSNQLSFMEGIAVPFKTADLVALKEDGINPAKITDNMAVVLGCNTSFPYSKQYIKFMARFFDEKLINVFTSKGAEVLMDEYNQDFARAVCYYRMALLLDSRDMMALFGYACACREWYLSLEGRDGSEQLVELLKAESTEYFEWCVIEHPRFAPSYYYLGFAYLNAALYSKAQFIWTRFIELNEDPGKSEIAEIKDRLAQLEDPVKIEEGINKLTVGDLESGLKILEPYVDSQYKDWWPLHYYLACTYRELEHPAEAIEGFKRVLSLSPSNYDACLALSEIYDELGDAENAGKYSKKCEIILKNNQ